MTPPPTDRRDGERPELSVTGPARPRATILLAHGSGAPMDSPFLEALAGALAEREIRVIRFEFPYMAARRAGGPRRPPDRMPQLEDAFRAAFQATGVPAERLAIGGKSLGGRVATRVADELGCRAVVVYGYPFHPPGKPDRLRTAHLTTLRAPCMILQGECDSFGRPDEEYGLGSEIRVVPVPAADHGFEPTRRSGRSFGDSIALLADETAAFLGPSPRDPAGRTGS